MLSFLTDPEKDWYTENIPLHMEIKQDKDENIVDIKHSMKTTAELTFEPHNTRLRELLKQLPRLTLKKNVLYRKFFEHNGDYYLQIVVPEHLEQELMCRIHDQLQHAGMQKYIQEFLKPFHFSDIYQKLRFHI